jgi:hypothetical protein
VKDRQQEWHHLYQLVISEKDPEKLRLLIRRINELLREKELRLVGEIKQPKGTQIFQIAYDERLLMTRAELLRGLGFEVTSALGNDDAKRLLKNRRSYEIFIIGHAATRSKREAMVKWVRSRFKGTKIIALNPPFASGLKGVDFNFVLNGPEEWLAAVASAAG